MSEPGALYPAWIDGELTPVDKLKTYNEGLKHQAVSVFVIRSLQILIQQRAMSKFHAPGLWANTFWTHPNWQETTVACAVRRLREELGIVGLYPEFRHRIEYKTDTGNDVPEHAVVDVFLARTRDDLELNPNRGEVMGTRWIDYHDLLAEVFRHPERFTPWLKIYLRDHANIIFGPDLFLASNS